GRALAAAGDRRRGACRAAGDARARGDAASRSRAAPRGRPAAVRAILVYTLARLRARRGRVLLAAGGIAAAGAMLGASVTVAYGLASGFDRTAARSQLPDILATFQPQSRADVARVVSSLANVRAASYRLQVGHVY